VATARLKSDGAQLSAPDVWLECNLAWAHARASRLRDVAHAADYAGLPGLPA
jgi:hypothetical protein